MAAGRSLHNISAVNEAARTTLRALAAGGKIDPMLRRLLLDALVNQDRRDRPEGTNSLVSSVARSATEWIGTSPEKRAQVLQELLKLADALPPQPKHGPPLPDKVSLVHEALADAQMPHAFGGALAVGYYGEPRATGDIDLNLFIRTDDWPGVRASFTPLGIDIQIDDRELKGFSELQLDWGLTPIHIFFSCDALHDQMLRALRTVPFNDGAIPLIAAEHLVVRKAVLDRPKDWHDIEQILVATEPLDVREIEDWLERMVGEDNPRIEKLAEVKAGLSLR